MIFSATGAEIAGANDAIIRPISSADPVLSIVMECEPADRAPLLSNNPRSGFVFVCTLIVAPLPATTGPLSADPNATIRHWSAIVVMLCDKEVAELDAMPLYASGTPDCFGPVSYVPQVTA